LWHVRKTNNYVLSLQEQDKLQLLLDIYHSIENDNKMRNSRFNIANTYLHHEDVDNGVVMRLVSKDEDVLIYFGYFSGEVKCDYRSDYILQFDQVDLSVIQAND
jgi:hypothetical protein